MKFQAQLHNMVLEISKGAAPDESLPALTEAQYETGSRSIADTLARKQKELAARGK